MRDYAKVAPQFWTGRTGKALKAAGPEAVIVAMYLMTSPHSNMIGVYHCPIAYISIDTGLTIEGAAEGLQRAIEADFCTFEADTEYVFVHSFAEYQIGAELDPKDLRCKGVANELAKVPKGSCWRGFRARYAVPFNLPIPTVSTSPLQAPSKPGAEAGAEPTTSLLTQATAFPLEKPPLVLVPGEPPKAKGPPDCPHAEVLALWAEVLPALPQHLPSQWRNGRAEHLRARWRETAVEKRWQDKAAGLAYFRKLFAYVGQSAFLTGRASPSGGKRPFVIELEWLVNPTNWAKVIEGKYHPEEATA
jgi:hypothetical protein